MYSKSSSSLFVCISTEVSTIQKNWCTVTVAPTIEQHGGHPRTPASQRWDQVPGRSRAGLLLLPNTSDAENSVILYVGSQEVNGVQVPRRSFSRKQRYSNWILWLQELYQNSHGNGNAQGQHHGHEKWTRFWCWQNISVVEFCVFTHHRST